MTEQSSSSYNVQYDFRPRKQVERRMIIHTFQKLAEAGFPISEYKYTGMGSYFFVDFILFRKVLGIMDMLSVESEIDLESRINFNKPYGDIRCEISQIADVIPRLELDKSHFLWLDYDTAMNINIVQDIQASINRLSLGSIFMITVDVDSKELIGEGPNEWREHFYEEFEGLLTPGMEPAYFGSDNLPNVGIEIIKNCINTAMYGRPEDSFELLFNFVYADGHEMLTIGGMIASKEERKRIESVDWSNHNFLRREWNSTYKRINVPILTRKERMYLDSNMPCPDGWEPTSFTLRPSDLLDYKDIFQYCPLYAELLL